MKFLLILFLAITTEFSYAKTTITRASSVSATDTTTDATEATSGTTGNSLGDSGSTGSAKTDTMMDDTVKENTVEGMAGTQESVIKTKKCTSLYGKAYKNCMNSKKLKK